MSQTPVLIYDGDCGFCRRCLDWGQGNLMAFPAALPNQDESAAAFGLSKAELESQVWLFGHQLRLGGARAIAYIFRLQPQLHWRLLGLTMIAFLPISNAVYKWVARNRGKLGSKKCSVND